MNSNVRKVVGIGFMVSVFIASSLGLSLTAHAYAESNAAELAQIQTLLKLIEQLQAQLAAIQGENTSVGTCTQLSRTLLLGSSDTTTAGEVTLLQQFLKKSGFYTYPTITGYYGSTTQQAVKSWQNHENLYEASGSGTIGSASRAKISESCNAVTIDQTSVSSKLNSFVLSGTAENVSSIFVALVRPYSSSATDWHTVYTTGSYVAFTGDTVHKVVDGKWEVTFTGIESGTYEARVYESSTSAQKLLATQPLHVSAPESFDYTAGSKKTVTLGVGQEATDGGVTITLSDVFLTNGMTGSSRATFILQSEGYRAASYSGGVGDYVPQDGGGISDKEARNGSMRLKIKSISQQMNTVTFTVEAGEPKG